MRFEVKPRELQPKPELHKARLGVMDINFLHDN